MLDLESGKPLNCRRIEEIIVKVLQYESRRIRWVLHLIDQRAERRCPDLEAFENITFVVQPEVTHAFDDDGLVALAAFKSKVMPGLQGIM
jgi:hypothetical protein